MVVSGVLGKVFPLKIVGFAVVGSVFETVGFSKVDCFNVNSVCSEVLPPSKSLILEVFVKVMSLAVEVVEVLLMVNKSSDVTFVVT